MNAQEPVPPQGAPVVHVPETYSHSKAQTKAVSGAVTLTMGGMAAQWIATIIIEEAKATSFPIPPDLATVGMMQVFVYYWMGIAKDYLQFRGWWPTLLG